MVKEGRVKLKTVKGEENVADHRTKPKARKEVEELLMKVGAEFRDYLRIWGPSWDSLAADSRAQFCLTGCRKVRRCQTPMSHPEPVNQPE